MRAVPLLPGRPGPAVHGGHRGQGYQPRFTVDGVPAYGMAGTGTFAEEVVLPVQAVVPIARDVPWGIALLIGCGVTTGVGAAINAAQVVPGSSVVVFGCGGVGVNVIQGARLAGAAEIVAVDLVEQKREGGRRFGATHTTSPDGLGAMSAELTAGQGFDDGFEVIGLPTTIRATYDAVRRGGTATIVGMGGADKMVEVNAFELFFNEKKLLGSIYGSADVRTEFGPSSTASSASGGPAGWTSRAWCRRRGRSTT